MENVLYEAGGGVATIRMNRPESLNALDAGMASDLREAFRAASADRAIRVVVLTGEGRAFCSGGDLKAMAGGLVGHAAGGGIGAILENFHELITCLWSLDVPVIAAVHGPAVGGGMSLALACDLRLASEDATFCQAFIKIGLTPDGGSTWLLPRLVGPARAALLTMTGETLDARTAYEWGLVSEVTAPGQDVARAQELARRMAGFSPAAMGHLKHLLRGSVRRDFPEQLKAEGEAQLANSKSEEFRAALAAFFKRKQ